MNKEELKSALASVKGTYSITRDEDLKSDWEGGVSGIRVGSTFSGEVGVHEFNDGSAYITVGPMRTSPVEGVRITDALIEVKTKNSIYVLKKVYEA